MELPKLDRKAKAACMSAMLGMLAACSSSSTALPGLVVAPADPALNQQIFATAIPANYILRASDVIRVNVFREDELSVQSVLIAADGSISLPLLGSVQAGGVSIQQLESRIEQELGARYLRNPDVAVNVINYGSHVVTVEGAVGEPGVYPFQPGTRLSGGIALASGLERVARAREIAVFRQGAEGMEIAKFDYAAMQAGTMMDPVILPGDRIVVGTDNLSQIWQDVLQAIPVFALFTRI